MIFCFCFFIILPTFLGANDVTEPPFTLPGATVKHAVTGILTMRFSNNIPPPPLKNMHTYSHPHHAHPPGKG
uniref:Putative secreted peptide n=1 Tax=Anopheles braziliensis TaxID=58242 RepID=A0A2M3ZU87_9DIPT